MAAQQGFQYEINASDALKKLNFVPKDFKPAGAGHDQPDLMIMYGAYDSGCELKITDASAGSLVLHYVSKDPSKPKWSFDPDYRKGQDPEKDFIRGVADSVGLLKLIESNWKAAPNKVHKSVQGEKWFVAKTASKDKDKLYREDVATFKELNGSIPASVIEKYYNAKKTYYVNVGTHGFYLFGPKNPLKFANVPKFSDSAEAKWRARVQYKGSGNYQFTFEMSFRMKRKSPFNIAPINKNSVSIIKEQIKLPTR